MTRLTIEVSDEEKARMKALAALNGRSLKEFVLERTLGQTPKDEAEALAELEAFLDARIARAEREGAITRSGGESFDEFCARKGIAPQHG